MPLKPWICTKRVLQLLHDCQRLHCNCYSKTTQLLILLERVPSVFLTGLRCSLLISFFIWSSRTPLTFKTPRSFNPLPSLKTWIILSSGPESYSFWLCYYSSFWSFPFSINFTLPRFRLKVAICGLFFSRISATISAPNTRSLVAVISPVGINDILSSLLP